MRITIRVLDGSLANTDYAFDLHEGEEVLIGRDPARCRLVMPSDYSQVSRQHCAMRAILGRIRLQVNKENPVLVDGQDGWDDSLVRTGSKLQLGRGGPRLLLNIEDRLEADGALPTNDGGREHHITPEQQLRAQTERTHAELSKHRKGVLVVGTIVAGCTAIGLFLALDARNATDKLVAASLTTEQRKSLMDLVDHAAIPRQDLGSVIRTAELSIYCVINQSGTNSAEVGTAWVVDKDQGFVATNSHVAAEFIAGKTFLRAQGKTSPDIPVAQVSIHPGYRKYEELRTRYTEALKISSKDKSSVACDVAILQVAPEHRVQLAPSLHIAPRTAVNALKVGADCAMVGFPAEGLAFNVEQPTARAHFGHIIATSDFFMAPAEPASAQLIHTDMPVTGGASGSPVLNADGLVVGIINEGSFALGMQGRRIPIAGTTYAQRIDILEELLAKDKTLQEARDKVWGENFQTMARNAQRTVEQLLIERFESRVGKHASGDSVEILVRSAAQLTWDGSITQSAFAYPIPSDGTFMFCAVSNDNEDIDAAVIFPNGEKLIDMDADWYPCVPFHGVAGQQVHFVVLRGANNPTEVSILVARARE